MNIKILCNFCNKNFSKKGFSTHINQTHKNVFSSNKERILYIIKIIHNLSNEIINNIIFDHENSSILSLKIKYNLPYKVISSILESSNIYIRNISESAILQSVKDKKIASYINNFGVKNPSQNEEIKNKKRKTFIEHYGTDNIFKFDLFKKSLNDILLQKYGVKRLTNNDKRAETNFNKYGFVCPLQNKEIWNKRTRTCIEKFGVENPTQSLIIKNKAKETRNNRTAEENQIISDKISIAHKNIWDNLSLKEKEAKLEKLHNITCSAIEKRIGNILTDLLIGFTHNFYIKQSKYTFQYDYLLSDIPIIIEVNGDFWHANPKYYSADDEICFPGIKKFAKQIWKKDRLKANIAKNRGYYVVYIWENEINNYSDDEILSIIIKRIENTINEQNSKN